MPHDLDYRALLVKYIRHVRDCEGVDYIEDGSQEGSGVAWAPGEWEALEAAAETATAERAAADEAWRKAHPPRPFADPMPFQLAPDVKIPVEYVPLNLHRYGSLDYQAEAMPPAVWAALEDAYRSGARVTVRAHVEGQAWIDGECEVTKFQREPVDERGDHVTVWLRDAAGREARVYGYRRRPDA